VIADNDWHYPSICLPIECMIAKGVRLLFFGNYFVGFLAVVLSVEAAFQLGIPLAGPAYYLSLMLSVILYYTYAYSSAGNSSGYNLRSNWYADHKNQIIISQRLVFIMLIGCTSYLFLGIKNGLYRLVFTEWLLLFSFPFAAISYYGLLPASPISLNLRNTGWLKAFVIGYVWAGIVTIFPLCYQKMALDIATPEVPLVLWFFAKNWMFCTINAIIFDMKDYAGDANRELKTFVVRMGLRKTIFYVLLPLTVMGLTALLVFSWYQNFQPLRIILNIVPFLGMLLVAWSMQLRRHILYYLIVIDGLLLVKAMCGIAGVWVENSGWLK
jgi:4-hydroxybenzoate polyprenyltransferase